MLDEFTCSILNNLPRGESYALSLQPDASTGMLGLVVSVDGQAHAVEIGYDNEFQFEADQEQIGAFLIDRVQKRGGCGGCKCG